MWDSLGKPLERVWNLDITNAIDIVNLVLLLSLFLKWAKNLQSFKEITEPIGLYKKGSIINIIILLLLQIRGMGRWELKNL